MDMWGHPHDGTPSSSHLSRSVHLCLLPNYTAPFQGPQRAKVITQTTPVKSAITIHSTHFASQLSYLYLCLAGNGRFFLNVFDSRSKPRDSCSRPRPLAYATNQWQTRITAHDHYKRSRILIDVSNTLTFDGWFELLIESG